MAKADKLHVIPSSFQYVRLYRSMYGYTVHVKRFVVKVSQEVPKRSVAALSCWADRIRSIRWWTISKSTGKLTLVGYRRPGVAIRGNRRFRSFRYSVAEPPSPRR